MDKNTSAGAIGTRNTLVRFSAVWSMAVLLAACDGRPSSPTGPTPPGPGAPPAVTYSLSGVVSEMTATGSAPIEGARVAEQSGRTGVTDANGHYSISGLTEMNRVISVSRNGYVTGTRTVAMAGDTQLDIRLERIQSYTLSGVVFEITEDGATPVEGVEVYCDSCGSPDGHTFVYTDAHGFYSLSWTTNGVHPLFVTKAGYDILHPAGTPRDSLGRISATVRGDTVFDVQLVRR
jgi:hypothetical protein